MPTLSCCLIVRDAGDTIQRVLESVRPHVDQLIVCDTGSEDDTIEIAEKYADRLKIGRAHV